MDFLFLPPIYLITLIVVGSLLALFFDHITEPPALVVSGILFLLYAINQFIFRDLINEEPERILGHVVYFTIFLGAAFITRAIKTTLENRLTG